MFPCVSHHTRRALITILTLIEILGTLAAIIIGCSGFVAYDHHTPLSLPFLSQNPLAAIFIGIGFPIGFALVDQIIRPSLTRWATDSEFDASPSESS